MPKSIKLSKHTINIDSHVPMSTSFAHHWPSANKHIQISSLTVCNGELASTEGTTQGDPLAMAMYALAITPLINQLRERCPDVQQVWYGDDATGCTKLKSWWDELSNQAPSFGYYPNASKTYLVVKEEFEASATELFADTDVHVTILKARNTLERPWDPKHSLRST